MKKLSYYKNSQKESIEERYKMEDAIMHLIATGNVREVEQLMKKPNPAYNGKVTRLPKDPLRDRKNGLVIRNTMFRIAAKNGGLPPLLLHHISEKYAILIERAQSVEYLDVHLGIEQPIEYAEAVHSFSTLTYSELIKNVVSYIIENLTESLSLNTLAEELHVHPAHLSRKFKQETNINVIDYIHIHRINHAKLLFQEGYTNILEVANLSGFNSSSYFNRIFKKVTKKTPSAYLKGAF